jgi:uncharacterized membrane protein
MKPALALLALLPLAASLAAAAASAQAPLYIDLSPGSSATDVTVAGNDVIVVGTNASGVFRWTLSSALEAPLGGIGSSSSPQVSTDGARVSATLYVNNFDTAAVWTGNQWVLSPSMGVTCGSTDTVASGISGDGLTVAGLGYMGLSACSGPHAFAWHWPSTLQDLGGFYSDPASFAYATNDNGTICVGFKDLLNGTRQGARWVNGAYSALNWLDTTTFIQYRLGSAQAVNGAGTVAVGGTIYGAPASAAHAAWRWDASTGNGTPLQNLAGAGTSAQALDLSDDGTVIVGHTGGNFLGTGSLIWLNNAPQSLYTYLAGLGTQGIAGYTDLGFVFACSRDGNVMCGRGTGLVGGGQPAGGWVVIFPGALQIGTSYCSGDGTATPCPCGNVGGAGRGCGNSIDPTGARLTATGAASLAADSVVLRGSGMPNSSALYFQGTGQQSGGAGSVFGDGLRCAAGIVIRLGTKANVSGASQYPAAGDASVSVRGLVASPGTRDYQVWYRNADPAFCTASTFNLSNGLELAWAP